MSEAFEDKLRELLAQSLAAWRIAGDVRRTGEGVILVCRRDPQVHSPPPERGRRSDCEGVRVGVPSLLADYACGERPPPLPLPSRGREPTAGVPSDSEYTDEIRIERAPPDLPFRWMVTVDGRRRGAVSLVAVLRQLRAALDPGYAKTRVRIAASALVPQ